VMEGREGVEKVGHGVYNLWCVHLKDNRCTIYEDRPQMCRDYNCATWAKTGKDINHYNKVVKIAGLEPINPDWL